MTKLVDRKSFLVVASMLAGAALWALVPGLSHVGGADAAALWSWSWDAPARLDRTAEGALIRTVVEPVAFFRNLALILLAVSAACWLLLRIGAALRLSRLSVADLPSAELEELSRQLAVELRGLVDLAATQTEHNRAFSVALDTGRGKLSAARGNEQALAAIQFLISANRQMLRSHGDYETRLRESQAQIASLRAALEETQELTQRDALTNAFSRRHFDETLKHQTRRSTETGQALSLVIADIDHFKAINDTYGHPVGDEVLRKVSDLLIANTKGNDSVARYGGEEFAIILPETSATSAAGLAEQIRQKLEAKRWTLKDGAKLAITASFGVAEFLEGDSADDLLRRADARLYQSKSAGRNLVTA